MCLMPKRKTCPRCQKELLPPYIHTCWSEHAQRVLRFNAAMRELFASLDFDPELRAKVMGAIAYVVGSELELLETKLKRGLDDPPR